jgi:phosphoenolpyruvate carboxylase
MRPKIKNRDKKSPQKFNFPAICFEYPCFIGFFDIDFVFSAMPRTDHQPIVSTRYHIYNSLFLNLPFSDVRRTGILLPLLQQACEEGFAAGKEPKAILEEFFADYVPEASPAEQRDLLFQFIQYTERQVVLFDSVEDSAFEEVNDLRGKGTLTALLMRAEADGQLDTLRQRIDQFGVRLVLTAHPTQFYPGNVLGIINDLERAIKSHNQELINQLLKQLGKTPFINREKPTPYDEAVSLCWYLENVFYHVVPEIVGRLMRSLGAGVDDWTNYQLIQVGFWPGGDRDGNPFVTSETTRKVAARLHETVLKCYYRDLRLLRRRLTFPGVENRLMQVERTLLAMAYEHKAGYQKSDELLEEIMAVREVLIRDHEGLFLGLLDDFIIKVRTFGFHMAGMDIRQDSRKHAAVWEEILSFRAESPAFASEAEEIDYILQLPANQINIPLKKDSFNNDLLETIRTIAEVQARNGEAGCHRYIISNCGSAVDMMRVFTLAKALITGDTLPLDVVPLFETIDDLAAAAEVMEQLYRQPVYRAHLKARGNKQTIMLGFSDGTKDGGYLRANWSIYRAKESLTAISRAHGITALFFDGRGGPPARGGGNTHDFYASLGETIEDREVQITIQGQTISSNFGKPASCTYNLEQLLSAGLENGVFGYQKNRLSPEEGDLLEAMAQEGFKAYMAFRKHPQFVPYLEKATPLPFFGDTNIGSRPVKRNASEGLKFEDLRAIPFVGSWAQMKQNIPGFYGVGHALEALQNQGKGEAVKALYKKSLFFRTLLSNSMMSLTKSYYPATAYLRDDEEFSALWHMMYEEYARATRLLLEVAGIPQLMEHTPALRASVQLRDRIVLPLVTIQQAGLQHLRTDDTLSLTSQTVWRKLVMRCMFGIINAARNSA